MAVGQALALVAALAAAAYLSDAEQWESLPLLGEGLAAYRASGAGFFLPNYLSILGDAYTQAGQFAINWEKHEATCPRGRRA